MAKKLSISSPAASFFTGAPLAPQSPVPAAEPAKKAPAPREAGPRGEYKTKRLNLLIRPSTYDRLREMAEEISREGKRKSVNDLINDILSDAVK